MFLVICYYMVLKGGFVVGGNSIMYFWYSVCLDDMLAISGENSFRNKSENNL